MNRKTIIFLSTLILVLVAVIVAGVYVLYSGVGTADSMSSALVQDTGEVEEIVEEAEEGETVAVEEEASVNDSVPVEVTLPQTFKVHNCGTGKLNTLRQNADRSLELLDEGGKSLWKIRLKSNVSGAVGEVDFYDNKKIQFLLCEGTDLHLIDRLGREVDGFPKKLPFSAVNGPVKDVYGQTGCWRIDTEYGPVYYDLKATKIITDTAK